ncbi:MAG: acetate--CoA ligase family protein, partial [Acidimicrobiia bacterium]|nr:acetate--CoA ligase family protein [Acidimicrobiia bacterium]
MPAIESGRCVTGAGASTLSEAESKDLLAGSGVVVAAERLAVTTEDAVAAADALGYPVVAKLNGPAIAHKTERDLVRLRLGDATTVRTAATELLAAATPDDGAVTVLIAPMVHGNRELIAGVVRDAQFGPTVMLGVGGILAEAVADVVFRPAPVDAITAGEMIDGLTTQRLLGEFRGEQAVDRDALAGLLVGLGRLIAERDDIASIDVNPVIIDAYGRPVAVDALVELGDGAAGTG